MPEAKWDQHAVAVEAPPPSGQAPQETEDANVHSLMVDGGEVDRDPVGLALKAGEDGTDEFRVASQRLLNEASVKQRDAQRVQDVPGLINRQQRQVALILGTRDDVARAKQLDTAPVRNSDTASHQSAQDKCP